MGISLVLRIYEPRNYCNCIKAKQGIKIIKKNLFYPKYYLHFTSRVPLKDGEKENKRDVKVYAPV